MDFDPTQQIDQSLKEQYHAICFNPQKKDVLQRFTHQNISSSSVCRSPSENSQDPCELISNKLVNNYIHFVYQKYQLEDPIHKQLRLNNQSKQMVDLNISTAQKTDKNSPRNSIKHTSTKDKLERMRNSYKQDSSQILYSTQYQSQLPGTRSDYKRQGLMKEIGYRTKEKIRFKTHINDDRQDIQRNRASQSFHLQEKKKYQDIMQQQQVDSRYLVHNGEVPMIFRYCPMCQEVILEHNIPYHESSCEYIKKAYDLPLEKLEEIFKSKIEKFTTKIQDHLNCDQVKKVQQYINLNKSVAQWLTTENDQLFRTVKSQYEKVALDQYYLLTKLDWFKKLHSKIRSKKQMGFIS